MSANLGRMLLRIPRPFNIASGTSYLKPSTLLVSPQPVLFNGIVRGYAARPGTRERKLKVKKANIAKKAKKLAALAANPDPKRLQKEMALKMKTLTVLPLFPDEQAGKPEAPDNVFCQEQYTWKVYSLHAAINNCKEIHHPTVYDNPRAVVKGYFELDLRTKKKTQFLENLSGVAELPYFFDTGKPIKTVCVFSKDAELNEKAQEAGAEMAVGLEGIKMFQEGDLDPEDYDVFVAHPDYLPDLAPLRGLISKKFPNMKKGTVAFDVVSLVKKFKRGVDYNMIPNPLNPKQGLVHVPIGTVDIPTENIAKNFVAVMEALETHQLPNTSYELISLGAVVTAQSKENFKVDLEPFKETSDVEDESEEEANPGRQEKESSKS